MGARNTSDGAATPGSGLFQVILLGDGSSGGSSSSSSRRSSGTSQSSHQNIREYKRRRPHKKSRGGCFSCKQRRVKCDQAVPACARCQRNGRTCVYDGPDSHAAVGAGGAKGQHGATRLAADAVAATPDGGATRALTLTRTSTTTTTMTTMTTMTTKTTAVTIPRVPQPQPFPFVDREIGTSSAALLHHVYTVDNHILGLPDFMMPVIPAAVAVPHFRGTLLAAAALHLYHKAPACRSHHLARHYQQTVALQGYQRALATPFAVLGQAGVDALLMTGMLMNALAFAMPVEDADAAAAAAASAQPSPASSIFVCPDPDPDPRRSWVFGTHRSDLGWLFLLTGMNALMAATAPWHATSAMRLPAPSADDVPRTARSGIWQAHHSVPAPWLALFGLERFLVKAEDDGDDGDGNDEGNDDDDKNAGGVAADETEALYWQPLRVVAELQAVPAMPQTVLLYFQFVAHIGHPFVQKLVERDVHALWLYGMWMGLMSRHADVWFLRRRARCDFRAVRLWLHRSGVAQRPGRAGALWRQALADLDATWAYDFAADPVMRPLVEAVA